MIRIIKSILPLLAIAALTSCGYWLELEHTEVRTVKPWEQQPAVWEKYKANIREYKGGDHYVIYALFANSPENAVSEKGYMRCLPDSLDYVSLTNADNFSDFDREDMAWMKSMGTKVLYRMDLAAKAEKMQAAELKGYAESAIAKAKAENMDGFSFTISGAVSKETASGIIAGLSATGLEVVLEGDPYYLAASDLEKISLFVLPTEKAENSFTFRNILLDALDMGIPKDKILPAASLQGSYKDIDGKPLEAPDAFAGKVMSEGPLKGLALRDIEDDYYHFEGNWLKVRSLIQYLNPSR